MEYPVIDQTASLYTGNIELELSGKDPEAAAQSIDLGSVRKYKSQDSWLKNAGKHLSLKIMNRSEIIALLTCNCTTRRCARRQTHPFRQLIYRARQARQARQIDELIHRNWKEHFRKNL